MKSSVDLIKQKEQSSTLKFIGLMRNLTCFISEDPVHQGTIYECLNSQEQARLFQSVHDQDCHLRITAINFLCYLLYHNASIAKIILKTQMLGSKYLLGGLEPYKLSQQDFRCIQSMKQLVAVIRLQQLKFKPNVLCWAIQLKTGQYYYSPFLSNLPRDHKYAIPYDPKTHLIGIFLEQVTPQRKMERHMERHMERPLSWKQTQKIGKETLKGSLRLKHTVSKE